MHEKFTDRKGMWFFGSMSWGSAVGVEGAGSERETLVLEVLEVKIIFSVHALAS